MISLKALSVPALLIVAACAQPEPIPEPIAPEPIFDKYGNELDGGGGCTGGQYAGTSSSCIPPTGQQGYDETGQQDGGGDASGNGGTSN